MFKNRLQEGIYRDLFKTADLTSLTSTNMNECRADGTPDLSNC